MRICHVITRLIVGGAQENTLLTCEGLQAKGHEVTLITGPDAGSEGSLLDRAREGAYRTCVIAHLHRAIRPRDDWRAKRELAAMFRELRPAVVHTHSSKAGVLGRIAARRGDGKSGKVDKLSERNAHSGLLRRRERLCVAGRWHYCYG